ncbi:hypothetical protein HED60_00520 [Planctomycetales bacterium ZRK34]|nr:hypothetical protein HED60_00520 [Planctomycetales bacterium ZRK34]
MVLCLAVLAARPARSSAVPIIWTDWTEGTSGLEGSATGFLDIGGEIVEVTYTGEIAFIQTNGGTNYYVPDAYSTTSDLVDNPPPTSDIIALSRASEKTLTFSRPIANPLFAVVSLNGNGYSFNQDFEILGYGRGYWGNGTLTKTNPEPGVYQLNGSGEPHGVIQFTGAFNSVSWTSLTNEYWNGFTIGVTGLAQPELATTPGDGGKLNFGYTRIGSTSQLDLEIANAGSIGTFLAGSTSAASGEFAGPDPGEAFNIGADAPLNQTFSYSPDGAGFDMQSITVDTAAGTHTITLQGIGVGPVFAADTAAGQTLDAGLVSAPGAMTIIELVISNNFVGNVGDDMLTALSLLDYSFTGTDASQFELLTPLDVIMAGDSLTLQVAFKPTAEGVFNDAQFHLLTDVNADYGQAGMSFTWNLIGEAENVPAPSMLVGALLVLARFRTQRRG